MNELDIKVLRLAAQICDMHGSVAGDRICQDWSDKTDLLDSLTPEERNKLMYEFEQFNSQGRDFDADYFPYDEMVISFIVSQAVKAIVEKHSAGAAPCLKWTSIS